MYKRQEHMLSDVLVYGADGSPEAKTMIYENKMAATSAQSPRTTGKKTVEMPVSYTHLDVYKRQKKIPSARKGGPHRNGDCQRA